MKGYLLPQIETNYKLSKAEKNCIAWHVITGCNRNDAFVTFCKPELKGAKVVAEKVASQFFSSTETIEYLNAYKEYVEKAFNADRGTVSGESNDAEFKARKTDAMKKLMNYVIEQANNIEAIEDKEIIIKFADKLGLLETEEEKVEAPRRYLPETCTNCRYKKFIEENCEEVKQ